MNRPVLKPTGAPEGYESYQDNTFNAYVGPLYLRADGGVHHALFEVKEHHLNFGGVVHGGMLMTFADMVLGQAARRAMDGQLCSTISLNCDFVASAKLGDWIQGTGRIVRKTRSILFLSGELYTEDRTLLTASGIWKVLGAP